MEIFQVIQTTFFSSWGELDWTTPLDSSPKKDRFCLRQTAFLVNQQPKSRGLSKLLFFFTFYYKLLIRRILLHSISLIHETFWNTCSQNKHSQMITLSLHSTFNVNTFHGILGRFFSVKIKWFKLGLAVKFHRLDRSEVSQEIPFRIQNHYRCIYMSVGSPLKFRYTESIGTATSQKWKLPPIEFSEDLPKVSNNPRIQDAQNAKNGEADSWSIWQGSANRFRWNFEILDQKSKTMFIHNFKSRRVSRIPRIWTEIVLSWNSFTQKQTIQHLHRKLQKFHWFQILPNFHQTRGRIITRGRN
jgi:hypothetical protein